MMRAPIWTGLGLVMLVGCPSEDRPDSREEQAEIEVRASVDKAIATIGDQLVWEVVVEHEQQIELTVPTFDDDHVNGLIVINQVTDSEQIGDRIRETRRITLRADELGSYVIPQVEVTRRDAEDSMYATSKLFVEVQSVLPANGVPPDLQGLKPLRAKPEVIPWSKILGTAGAFLLAIGLVKWWRRKRVDTSFVSVDPPQEVALAALARLSAHELTTEEELHQHGFDLSDVVKAYIEGQFGFNATDLTSEELTRRCREEAVLVDDATGALSSFVKSTDAIKYAAHTPSQEEVHMVRSLAIEFVTATIPTPVEEGVEEAS